MVSSTRHAIGFVLLIFSAVVCSYSQTTPGGSISGKVTVRKKPVAGAVVIARDWSRERSRHRGTTDDTGTYHITNLPAGSYQVAAMVTSLVPENELPNNIVLNDGEAVEDINFALVPGGVITGKITDADGRPLIEAAVSLWPVDTPNDRFYGTRLSQTDDRGIYRAFRLRPGKYRVSVGGEESRLIRNRQSYRQTFYPSVTDAAKATIIEVTQGSEANNIDIVVGRAQAGFKVTGRIVDGETGKPVPNVMYGLNRLDENGSESGSSGSVSNANGDLKFENLLPGKYSVMIPAGRQNIRADLVPFEVVDRDVTDLLVKTKKAASISGVVVFEGMDDATLSGIREIYLDADLLNSEANAHDSVSVPVKPDRSFTVVGLPAGVVDFGYIAAASRPSSHLTVVRIERDGVDQPQGIDLKDGEQVTGVRVVVRSFTGAIHGEVKVEGYELPANSRLSVWAELVPGDRVPGARIRNHSPQVDSRNRFLIEGLAAGTYEITVAFVDPSRRDGQAVYKEQVTVTDNAVSEVTVTVKPKP